MRIVIVGLLLLMSGLLSGCFSEFRISIPQGNIITPHAISQLKLGMTQRQVRFVLGTPLIRDPFNHDRWDYYHSLSKNGGKPVHHRLTLFFKNGILTSAEGDLAPPDLRAGRPSSPQPGARPGSS